jgi:hypothetical protein
LIEAVAAFLIYCLDAVAIRVQVDVTANGAWDVKPVNIGGRGHTCHSCYCGRIGAFGLRPSRRVLWIVFIDISDRQTRWNGGHPVAIGVGGDGLSVTVQVGDQHIHISQIRLVC